MLDLIRGPFLNLISLVGIPNHVVGITKHVVTTISAFSFTMLLLDRILTHIVNHISNTSYHLQYLYCQGGYVFDAKPNLITCEACIFLSVVSVGGARPPPFTISTITYKVVMYAPAERADTLPLFLLYPYMYSVVETSKKVSLLS
jgi:hypothetical protein